MDDITLVAKLDNDTTLYVSPMHDQTYSEFVEQDNLGGSGGYFIAANGATNLRYWQRQLTLTPHVRYSEC